MSLKITSFLSMFLTELTGFGETCFRLQVLARHVLDGAYNVLDLKLSNVFFFENSRFFNRDSDSKGKSKYNFSKKGVYN